VTLDPRFYFPIEIYVKHSNEIEGIFGNEQADNDYIDAWLYLVDTLQFINPINEATLKTVHKMIADHQTDIPKEAKGEYRGVHVYIGSGTGAEPSLVPHLMSNWFLDHAQTNDPLQAHVIYEKIHPWYDCNGRTGRIVYWYQCLQNNQTPILFTADRRFDYYQLFTNY